ncbi:hypothetical protein K402DRAFT_379699 [Aulographum hederae CBS 113979]|uniref:Uncharacterized protein n=1 Tax=Aulographum hederae CBS 113979 TaxID=1176131 RepID=A0A6G1GX38_9PEZI|nr:hypothetical protein K402DRAFT_379699 [Aulographum hederae CBS 113979]
MTSSQELSPAQAHALLDILTHHQTYAEIEKFKLPGALEDYGPPFAIGEGATPTSPILQGLLSRFLLTLPGLRDVDQVFWKERVGTLIAKLGEAGLSESFDKGSIGSRKTLATAISALIEYPARGVLGGFPCDEIPKKGKKYDKSKPDDVMGAFRDFLQAIIHGDMLDELFDVCSKTDKLEDHSSLVRAAHEFLLVNLAAFLHYIMILSPDGQYLNKILENVHKLIPYQMVRQSLRVGNAATMINGIMKLVLSKMTINTLTSFIGLTKSSDAGMNLMQSIISTVLWWDNRDFRDASSKIEKSKTAPSKEHREALKKWTMAGIEAQQKSRTESQTVPKSIVSAILDDTDLPPLPEDQHEQALDYLSLQLSIRDRDELSRLLCSHQPDLITQTVRDGVAAYDPIIRSLHKAVDLNAGLSDLQNFLDDLIKVSKIPPNVAKRRSWNGTNNDNDESSGVPTVEDFVNLLRKHQGSAHRFLHQVAKNGPEMTELYREYAKHATSFFRKPEVPTPSAPYDSTTSPTSSDTPDFHSAGAMTGPLQTKFSALAPSDQEKLLPLLDAHAAYLTTLYASSRERMISVLSSTISSSPSSTSCGPGMYLARWRDLLDATALTPAKPNGEVRSGGGSDRSLLRAKGVSGPAAEGGGKGRERVGPRAPDVGEVVRLMGEGFKEVLAEEAAVG